MGTLSNHVCALRAALHHARMLLGVGALAVVLCLGSTNNAQAQGTVTQVADLNTGSNGFLAGGINESQRAVFFDGKTFFTMHTPELGAELWVTDGAALGTRLFADVCPGQCGGLDFIVEFYVEGSNLYFAADDGVHGSELWRLAAGATAPVMIADINPGAVGSFPFQLVRASFVVGATVVNRTYFSAVREDIGRELWRLTDGASPSVALELDVRAGALSSEPRRIQTCANSQICFIAVKGSNESDIKFLTYTSTTAVPTGVSGIGDFPASNVRTDDLRTLGPNTFFRIRVGTAASELRVFGSSAATSSLLDTGTSFGTLFFNVSLFKMFYLNGNALRASDGTVAGTTTIASAAIAPRSPSSVGNRVLFIAQTASSGRELFSSDGTVAGTAMLKELVAGASGINDSDFNTIIRVGTGGSRLFLSFQNPAAGNDTQLWVSDATAAGTVEISGNQIADSGRVFILPSTGAAAILGYERQLGGNGEPFFTTGLIGGTTALGNFVNDVGDSYPSAQATINQTLVFNATIDGLGGTRTLPVGASAPVQNFPNLNGDALGVYFGKLWVEISSALAFSDGTSTGTVPVPNVRPNVSDPGCIVARNGLVYFPSNAVPGVSNGEIFKSDGTVAGTVAVTNFGASPDAGLDSFCFSGQHRKLAAVGDKLLFEASAGIAQGYELFALNASDAASLVLDINPGSSDSRLGGLTTLTGRGALPDVVVFTANDGIFGSEIWVTSGTAQSTQRISDINIGPGDSEPRGFLRIGNKVLFTAYTPASGRELYVSDGTATGTVRVVDLFAGIGSGITRELLGVAGGRVYFTGLSSTLPNCILFESDGTAAGTRCAYDSASVTLRRIGDGFAVTQSGAVVFSATRTSPINDGEEIRVLFNRQLLTLTGADVAPGSASSAPSGFLVDGHSVYFRADDGVTGSELWRLDLPNLDRLLATGFE